ncbi:MAG: hypothetical protein KDB74_11320 [Flavobacteriales bacterium]|nr:hypothetical protein [Flavobacteriales bacterium]
MKKYISIIILFLAFEANAQQDFIMYGLQDIPQSTYNNPSNRFNGNFYIGLPALSSNYFNFSNSGFAYSDAVKKNGDSLLLDFNSLLSTLGEKNYLSFNTKIDLLSFGITLGDKTQLTVNVTENANFKLSYPKDFIQFIYKGNTGFSDNKADFSGIGISVNHYREYGIGISHQLSEKLRLGLRAKYLYGMENIYSEKTDLSLTSDPETYAMTAKADVIIRTAGIDGVDSDEAIGSYLMNRKNTGFAADLGADYQLNDKLSFNASVLDLGFINWNSYTKSHIIDNGEYTFSGVAINVFSANEDSSDTPFDRIGDSIEDAFKLKENTDGYKAPLTARAYLGVNYKLTDRDMTGLLVQSEFFQGTIRPSFTLNYSRKMTKWITLATSYTAINGSYNNVGFGFSIDPGPVQLYVVSDNVLGAFQPQNTRHLQLRFGINLIFGRDKSKEIRPKTKAIFNKKDQDEEEETKVDDNKEDSKIEEENNDSKEEIIETEKENDSKEKGLDKQEEEINKNKSDAEKNPAIDSSEEKEEQEMEAKENETILKAKPIQLDEETIEEPNNLEQIIENDTTPILNDTLPSLDSNLTAPVDSIIQNHENDVELMKDLDSKIDEELNNSKEDSKLHIDSNQELSPKPIGGEEPNTDESNQEGDVKSSDSEDSETPE